MILPALNFSALLDQRASLLTISAYGLNLVAFRIGADNLLRIIINRIPICDKCNITNVCSLDTKIQFLLIDIIIIQS